LILYWNDTGTRRVVTLKGPDVEDGDLTLLETNVGKDFTRHTSKIARDGLVDLYWHDAEGKLLVDRLNSDGTLVATSYAGTLSKSYGAIAAIGDRFLGFHIPNFDVFDVDKLTELDHAVPLYGTGLNNVDHLVAFELGGIPLLFLYSMTGTCRVVELAWTETSVGSKELGPCGVLTDAQSVTGLNLPEEQLIFVNRYSTDPALQVISIKLKLIE
jgi:hypothetical protein